MMVRLLEDLRFVVGLLFGILGVILLGAGLATPRDVDPLRLNLVVGAVMTTFALVMIGVAAGGSRRRSGGSPGEP